MATPAAGERRSNIADFRVVVDGTDISSKIRPRLVSLTLDEKRGNEADELNIVLDDTDGLLALPKKGATVQVSIGWAQGSDVIVGMVDKGSFKVDEVTWEGPPDQITIRARSADLTGKIRARKERSFKNTTLGAVARKIAADNGLEAKIAPELDGIRVECKVQHQLSDMALLERLGRENDAVATVKKGKLILSPIGKASTTSGKALAGATIIRADGDRYRYSELDRSADAGVEARWHDTSKGQRKTVKVGGGGGTPRRLRKVYSSEGDARTAANAEATRAKRGAAEFEINLALGRPDLIPERPTTVRGFKPAADAKAWIIAELSHSLNGSGLNTRLKLETKG